MVLTIIREYDQMKFYWLIMAIAALIRSGRMARFLRAERQSALISKSKGRNRNGTSNFCKHTHMGRAWAVTDVFVSSGLL
jgi:hypothetical protein